jgi:hypothetical protein
VVSASSDPCQLPQLPSSGETEHTAKTYAALAKVSEAEDEPEELTTGLSEARSHQHRRTKKPTLMPQTIVRSASTSSQPKKNGLGSVGMTIR